MWETILPFIKPLEPFILDPEASDILVNGPDHEFIEGNGQLQRVNISLTEKMLDQAGVHIARRVGDDISADKPLLDALMPDGSRVAAAIRPCSLNGTILAIRKTEI